MVSVFFHLEVVYGNVMLICETEVVLFALLISNVCNYLLEAGSHLVISNLSGSLWTVQILQMTHKHHEL